MKTAGAHDRFFSLLSRTPGATKEDLVWQYSGMLTNSLKEFYKKNPEGYKRMLADMQSKADQGKPGADPELKRLRSNILHRLQKHGIDTTEWANVNAFMVQPRIAGKPLFEMSIEEMKTLIPKLEMILRKDAEKRDKEIELSTSN